MSDIGLLVSIVFVLVVPSVFVPLWPPGSVAAGVLDVAGGALAIGLVVGRLTAVALDDPGSLTSLSDLLIIRSGVEFWPGVAAGLAWLVVRSHREQTAWSVALATLAPAGLISWAAYEATCLARDGCPGPVSPIGLRPDGLTATMFPVGLVVAFAGVAFAVWLMREQRRGLEPPLVWLGAVLGVAVIRSVASVWLPHIGNRMTRQHQFSIAVALAADLALVVAITRRRRSPRPATL